MTATPDPYLSVAALTERLGYEHPDAAELVELASDVIDSVICAPFSVDPTTGIPVNPVIAAVCEKATLRQVQYMLYVDPAKIHEGAPRNGTVQTPRWTQTWQPGKVGPLALDVLANAGLLVNR